MQIHREFTVPDIAMVVARDDPAAAFGSLQAYLRQLVAAGYVMRSAHKAPGTAVTSNGFNLFRLIRDTGGRSAPARGARLVLQTMTSIGVWAPTPKTRL